MKCNLKPLVNKHYSTDIEVKFKNCPGTFLISISGEGTVASDREGDWEPCDDMNHVESREHLYLANIILDAIREYSSYD